MRLLVVCSKNSGKISPFIVEQVEGLKAFGTVAEYFTIEQKGWQGYLKSRRELMRKIRKFNPDIIHAHFGLSGLLANLQQKVPVITTYHGSDINNNKVFCFSKLSILLSKYNIFVSQKNLEKANLKKNYSLIPCGVNIDFFIPQDKTECRKSLGLELNKKLILFAGAFDNKVKNGVLGKQSIELLQDERVELLELKNYTRKQVVLLMNAVDCCLMTSFTEGSPQFIKEAMSCNCPIVSVDVGDVKEVIQDTEGCYICDNYNANKIAENLQKALDSRERTEGRKRIIALGLSMENVSKKLIEIYRRISV